MHTFINSPLQIGSLTLPHRLIQGPLAGYSCAPFRELFNQFHPPAYCVSEMISAQDVLTKHSGQSRYLHRSTQEKVLAYQISGTKPEIMAQAALYLENLGADLIDINCGCPKTKIRKKGAGSALLENPQNLVEIISKVRSVLSIPLTVKIRIQGSPQDLVLAKQIEEAGADALIVHGRRWTDDYDVACDLTQIKQIKSVVSIPVIANGDIADIPTLNQAITTSACDGFMVARAGCGRPWLFQELLLGQPVDIDLSTKIRLFMTHLQGLALLEDDYKAMLQSKSLIRYYFKKEFSQEQFESYYQTTSLAQSDLFLHALHA